MSLTSTLFYPLALCSRFPLVRQHYDILQGLLLLSRQMACQSAVPHRVTRLQTLTKYQHIYNKLNEHFI